MKTDLLFSSYPFITSEKVTLTRISELDLSRLWEILGDEGNYRFRPTAPLASPGECAGQLRRMDRLFREKRAVVLGIYPNGEDQRLAGIFEITLEDPQVACVTLDIILHPGKAGQGLASAAVRAGCAYLFRTIGVRRVQAYVLPIHYRAAHLFEGCGFQKEGTIREGFLWPDKGIVDLTLYSLLPSDWRKKDPKGPTYYL